jgi:hypothetical protein
VLASLQLHNIVARFFICLYIICNIIYTIIREGSCMGYLKLSGRHTAFEEAKLRIVCYFLGEKKTCLICVQLSKNNIYH